MSSGSPSGRNIRRIFSVVAPTVVLALVLSLAASTSAATSQTTSQTVFRQQFTTYLVQMQNVATAMEATQAGRAAFKQVRFDPERGVARAREAVRTMTPARLAVLQKALSAYPAWRTMPAKLGTLVRRLRAASSRSLAITPDDCATARAAGYTQTDVEIAADVALAADVILEAIPSDTLAEPVRIVAVIVWAIPQGVLRGFEHLYNIASACDDADHQALVSQNLDVKVSTRATQTSLDSLTNNFNTFNTTFNTLNTLVNSRLDVAVSTRATQASLDTFHNEFTSNATIVNTKLDSANTKLDNLAIQVGNNGALDLRLKIEEDLSQPGAHPIALFEIPASGGGYLDLTRSIVADTIAKMQAAGQGIGQAQAFLAAGNAAVSAHDYKTAYADFGKAYRAAA
ncbi:MAG TPA: hypothetical protein VF963_01095 [Gaiellaceae bacterium]